jgi:hypothetical protein
MAHEVARLGGESPLAVGPVRPEDAARAQDDRAAVDQRHGDCQRRHQVLAAPARHGLAALLAHRSDREVS